MKEIPSVGTVLSTLKIHLLFRQTCNTLEVGKILLFLHNTGDNTMNEYTIVDNAKVMAKGQITIPKDIRSYLGVSCGDRLLFIIENGNVLLVNPAVYAMKLLQKGMQGEAEKAGLTDEDSVNRLAKEIRNNRE